MKKYQFETREFGISEKGLHKLRSRYNYETIDYSDIKEARIELGKELNNWIAILIIGFSLLIFSIWYVFRLFLILSNNAVNSIYIEEIIVPLFPFILGGYCIYSSTRNGIVIHIKTSKNKTFKYPLREIVHNNELDNFKSLLKERLRAKVQISI